MAARDILIVRTASADPQRWMARTCPTPKVTVADLENWLAVAAPGDALDYHRGFLAMDRSVGGPHGDDDGKELGRVADAAMALAKSGHVHLVQRRHGSCDYTYLAIASRPLRRRPDRQPAREATS